MSQSVEAKLYFGFVLNVNAMTDKARALVEGSSATKVYAARKGLVEPPYTYETIEQWRAWDQQFKDLVGGLKIDRYYADDGEDEQVMYVCAKTYSVWKDGAEALDAKALWVRHELTAKLKDFCDTLDIPWTTPQWHLVCYREH